MTGVQTCALPICGSWTQITSYPYTNSPVTNGWSDGTGQRTIIEVDGGDYLQTADGGATWTTWTQPFPNAVPAFMSTDATIVGRAEDDYNYFPWVGGWDNTAQRLPQNPKTPSGCLILECFFLNFKVVKRRAKRRKI